MPVLPALACGALIAGLRCCNGLGVEAAPLPALACSLLQQWQQQKYGEGAGVSSDRQVQQLLDGGLPDEAEVELIHCLLTGQRFSPRCVLCARSAY